jgi:hypothetical protein
MRTASWVVGLVLGTIIGAAVGAYAIAQTVHQASHTPIQDQVHNRHLREQFGESGVAYAGTGDRYEDYVMCTGAVAINPRTPTDGLWVLDYRAGKLLGTVIDRGAGKITGFAEVNLVNDFQIPPKQNVHFMMTTGSIAQGQSALYVVETTTGKFGIYTLGADPTGAQAGLIIRKHDMGFFRKGN